MSLGPWVSNGTGLVVIGPNFLNSQLVAEVFMPEAVPLIEAAPELLEQARRFQQALRQLRLGQWSERDLLAMAPALDAVIAKAEGAS